MTEFQDQVVVVTGAAGAVGRAVARHFGDLGGRLALLDLVDVDAASLGIRCDLTDPDSCNAAVAEVETKLGPIDVLANVAGGFTMGEQVADTSDDTWNFMFDLNARSVLNMARAAVPGMRASGGGKIVNIGARAGLRGVAAMGAYCASKSVVIRLTEALADELKEHGINVNCVLPSIIDTERNRQDMPDADFERWVRPEEIAAVVAFLASSAAGAIHGAAIPVEGLS